MIITSFITTALIIIVLGHILVKTEGLKLLDITVIVLKKIFPSFG